MCQNANETNSTVLLNLDCVCCGIQYEVYKQYRRTVDIWRVSYHMQSINLAIAFTHRPLNDDELFQVKIDRLVDAGTTPSTLFSVGLIDCTTANAAKQRWTLLSSQILHQSETVTKECEQSDLDDLKVGTPFLLVFPLISAARSSVCYVYIYKA